MIPAVSSRTPTSVGSRSILLAVSKGSGSQSMRGVPSATVLSEANCNDSGAMMNSYSIGWLVGEALGYGALLTSSGQRCAGITPLHVSHEAIEELPVPAMCLG